MDLFAFHRVTNPFLLVSVDEKTLAHVKNLTLGGARKPTDSDGTHQIKIVKPFFFFLLFASTRYRTQLFDLNKKDYLTFKTSEHKNQQTLQRLIVPKLQPGAVRK